MGKIAVELEQALARRAREGTAGTTTPRPLAGGPGWSVADVLCTCGPGDRTFEERHSDVSIGIVAAGSFGYRNSTGRALLTPGSLLLGNVDQCFECGHEHGRGDRCVAFRFSPAYFERIAADAGARPGFPVTHLPALRGLASLVTRALAGAAGATLAWEELSLELAARVAQLAAGLSPSHAEAPPSAVARVTAVARLIESDLEADLSLATLAGRARLSPWHFLRAFEQVTGLTPHQFILRARLREAALRLTLEPARVLDVALASGFRDLSNFNHTFRSEFRLTPTQWRVKREAWSDKRRSPPP